MSDSEVVHVYTSDYHVYAIRMQAKKIISILIFTRFSGKGRHPLHYNTL